MKTGLTPDQVRKMTPADTGLWIDGWNEAQSGSGGMPEAMTPEEYRNLVERYG